MMFCEKEKMQKKISFEDAMDYTGVGKYNVAMLVACGLLILAMYIDIFGFSVVIPAVACDMALTSAQQGLLSAVPLVGVMISSYAWGLCADTLGRRTTLLIAMPVGGLFNLSASLAPNYVALAVLKFLSASFTSSANVAGFVLLGESLPSRIRSRFIFYLVVTTMVSQLFISIFALPIFELSFYIEISWLGIIYRPWRLLLLVISIPGLLGCVCIAFLKESPKFLLCKDKEQESINVLKSIYKLNNGKDCNTFPVCSLYLDEIIVNNNKCEMSFLHKMWTQTAPLFKPPLLKNNIILYILLICAYMPSTGFTMWVPTVTNTYFNAEDATGLTFCEVAASSVAQKQNSMSLDCDHTIQPMTLYVVMVYSGTCGVLAFLLSLIVGPMGKKKSTILVFVISTLSGLAVLFVRIPAMSLVLFYLFCYVALILGNMNTYLVELNPTHLRGMATCLSVVVARGIGFVSVQLISIVISDYCTPMFSGYLVLVTSGLLLSLFLPSDAKKQSCTSCDQQTEVESSR